MINAPIISALFYLNVSLMRHRFVERQVLAKSGHWQSVVLIIELALNRSY